MENYFPVLFLSLFILLGLAITASSLDEVRKSWRSVKWPRTAGTITRSDIKVESHSEGFSYLPDIEFTYTVGEATHRSTSVRVGKISMSDKGEVPAFNKRYPVGKEVTVAYDPLEPSFGVLEPGLFRQSLTFVIFGSLFACFPAGLLLLFWLMQP